MKNLIIFVLVLSLLIPAGVVLANPNAGQRPDVPSITNRQEAPTNSGNQMGPQNSLRPERENQNRAEFAKVIREFNQEIRKTHLEFVELRKENIKLIVQLREAISEAREDESVDPELLVELAQTLKDILSSQEGLQGTMGEVRKEWGAFNRNRKGGSFDTALESLQSVIDIQKTRIEILESINAQLKRILEAM